MSSLATLRFSPGPFGESVYINTRLESCGSTIPCSEMSNSELFSLQTTLNEALDAFRAEIAAQNLPEPSLQTSEPHPMDHITYLPSPVMFEARRAALACLGQLMALIRNPYDAIAASSWSAIEPASLRLAAYLDLATIIGDSEDGISVSELTAKTGIEEAKLERVFRCLITQGWFREPREGYFANSRMSNIIKNDQPGFHMATTMNHLVSKSAVYLPNMINHPDPEYRKKADPSHCAFQMAFNTDLPYFGPVSWCSKHPEDATRFALAMGGVGPSSDPGTAGDFPWTEICKGKDALVDLGGGQGTLCCSLALKYPEIEQFIVQDLADCREAAEANIKSKNLTDRVIFEEQDFFTPQKRKGKYVFVIQRVLHNWSNENGGLPLLVSSEITHLLEGAKILRQIRDVLNEESNLLIIESLNKPAVVSSTGPSLKESLSKLDNNVYSPVPPPPFVPINFGEANRNPNSLNVVLSAVCGAFGRTLPQMEEMVAKAGLKIKKIHATRGWPSIIEVGLA
ncbi:hypothetical protein D9756_006139 [Leucocoprinus leucothites]|uniref:S-adenosyl-L-methionine-dependent methyltransferase n=1 Tax=Leucocoprinus leucothites TaxID=201217 RepID=A0A8H5D3S5_9AGAR|nr:hypothetical protein D9756_006139 [Leucoagaricus leucothites]